MSKSEVFLSAARNLDGRWLDLQLTGVNLPNMDRFSKLKIPLIIIAAALGWAFVANPLISHLAQRLEPTHRDQFRSLNDFIVILLVSLVLYRRISRQAPTVYPHLFGASIPDGCRRIFSIR
jgi:hypothetical protein